MKKLAIALTVTAVAGLAIYAFRRRMKQNAMRENIANEGYETAHDILYPRRGSYYHRKLQYGPVLPG